MNIEDALNYLNCLVHDKSWFYAVYPTGYKQIVVHALWQSKDILELIPEFVGEYQVLVHFALPDYKKEHKPAVYGSCIIPESDHQPELKIDSLIKELDRLEKVCGSHTLQDIFYEVQDGKNAVTDMSKRYPEVRSSLEKLFDVYGFDVIYEEIDG